MNASTCPERVEATTGHPLRLENRPDHLVQVLAVAVKRPAQDALAFCAELRQGARLRVEELLPDGSTVLVDDDEEDEDA